MNGNIIAVDSNPASLIAVIIFLLVSIWLFRRAYRSHHQILSIIAGLLVIMFLVTTFAVAVGGTNGVVITQGAESPQPSTP